MIRSENLVKQFDDTVVLKGITTEFYQGKCNLIIGRSGAGKTVMLKMLVGLLTPTEGKVFYGDIDFFSLTEKQKRDIRMRVGMLFQANALFDSMTVAENISFPMDMFTNRTVREKRKRVDYCLERVSLTGVNDKYPSEISGGMQKRVGIARAIVLKPDFLFCDEPNSGLDPKTSMVIDELIQDITQEQNITTIINTHDMNSVMGIGDNILLLSDGEVAWRGQKEQIMRSDNEVLQDFIFASPFLQDLRDKALSSAPSQEQ